MAFRKSFAYTQPHRNKPPNDVIDAGPRIPPVLTRDRLRFLPVDVTRIPPLREIHSIKSEIAMNKSRSAGASLPLIAIDATTNDDDSMNRNDKAESNNDKKPPQGRRSEERLPSDRPTSPASEQ